MSPRETSQLVPITKFTKKFEFQIAYKPQEEVWPYIETGRRAKTFTTVKKLG
jgi:hypothetical protein